MLAQVEIALLALYSVLCHQAIPRRLDLGAPYHQSHPKEKPLYNFSSSNRHLEYRATAKTFFLLRIAIYFSGNVQGNPMHAFSHQLLDNKLVTIPSLLFAVMFQSLQKRHLDVFQAKRYSS